MGKEGGDQVKKDDGTVILKIDLHCEGCAEKLMKSVREFDGVEKVKADVGGEKLMVRGKVDPGKLRVQVEAKTQRKVELASPANPPKMDASEKIDSKNPVDEKGTEKPCCNKCKYTTVVLKIHLHCDDCIHQITKTIRKIKGVKWVYVDKQTDLVTVKGKKMDAEALQPKRLGKQLKRSVIDPKEEEEDKGSDKKEKGDGGDKKEKGSDKKEKDGGGEKKDKGSDKKEKDGGGEKKDKGNDKKEKDGGGGKDDGGKAAPAVGVAVANPMGCHAGGYPYPYPYHYPYPCPSPYPYPYRAQMVHAPQLFSDENPNACSVM